MVHQHSTQEEEGSQDCFEATGAFELNEKILKENERRLEKLIEAVKPGESVLFVGSGINIALGYPTWKGLIEALRDLAKTIEPDFPDYSADEEKTFLEYADDVKKVVYDQDNHHKRYFQTLGSLFNPDGKTPTSQLHRDLLSIPFKGVVTTNYDVVLEHTRFLLDSTNEPGTARQCLSATFETGTSSGYASQFLRRLSLTEGESKALSPSVGHLHGHFQSPQEMIVSESEYKNGYLGSADSTPQGWTGRRKVIWSLLSTRRMVFVGFGMNDPYLMRLFEDVCSEMWEWGQPHHFFISGLRPSDPGPALERSKVLQQKYAVETVFYTVVEADAEDEHQNLHPLIQKIKERANSLDEDRASQDENVAQIDEDRSTTAANITAETSRFNRPHMRGVRE